MGPSTSEVEGVREALDAAGLTPAPFYVESSPNPGLGRCMVIIGDVPRDAMTADVLREILRVVYENTPESFTSYVELSINVVGSYEDKGYGESVYLVDLVEELGLTYVAGGGAYRFKRADLEVLFG